MSTLLSSTRAISSAWISSTVGLTVGLTWSMDSNKVNADGMKHSLIW